MKALPILLFFGMLTILTLETSGQRADRGKADKNKPEVNTKKKSPVKMIEYLIGEWKVDKILQGKKDVTEAETQEDQTMTFTDEARYVKHAGNAKTDSGAFRMNEQLQSLYLESESNSKPTEWKVTFESGAMVLSSKPGSGQPENLKYYYRRISPATAKKP
jgi:hypothetical protein